MRNTNFKFLIVAILAASLLILTGCPKTATPNSDAGTTADPNETAATVNGTAIKLQEVERAVKQQAQGQESKLSQLELAQARLQILEQLIQGEVMYQKAQKEETIPTDEEVTAALNKAKTESGQSKEQFEKNLKEAGMTEADAREQLKKQLAITKLLDKVTGKIEPPSDNEIEAFYDGNKAAFVKKRGVNLAAIVVDPTKTGEDDTTTDEASTKLRMEEISKKLQGGMDFSTVASELSEDPSRMRKGELGYITEEQMTQTFSPQLAEAFMSKDKFPIGQPIGPFNISGKFYIFKIQERVEKEETVTLESPGVRQQITDNLVNARKQILQASYAAVAMDEAEIVNYLAQKVVNNPNELSGARPAGSDDVKSDDKVETNSNTNTETNTEANKDEADKAANTDDKKAESKKADDVKPEDKKEEKK